MLSGEANGLRDGIKPVQLAQCLGPAPDELPELGPPTRRHCSRAEHLLVALDILLQFLCADRFQPAAVKR